MYPHRPADTWGAVEEPGCRYAADGERRDERTVRYTFLLHQALPGFRYPMDGNGVTRSESPSRRLVGNGDLALREPLRRSRGCMGMCPRQSRAGR